MSSGYAYSGVLDVSTLKNFLKDFFTGDEIFHIKEEIDSYLPDVGLPDGISPKGRVFSDSGEARWEEKDNKYNVLVLTENKIENLPYGFFEAGGNWDVEANKKVYLAPLNMGCISPKFNEYPKDAKYLMVCFYKKDGRNVFISPRRFENER